jgi:ribosomal protein L18
MPWIELRYHMFQREGDNKFVKFIDPRTFEPKAHNPIAERANLLWKSENSLDKELAKKLFAKSRWFTLIYVKEAPESQKKYEGKVLVYEIGKQVYDKLDAAINDYEMPFWDPEAGNDMLLVLKQKNSKDKWPDYTDSAFKPVVCPISKNKTAIEYIETALDTITIKSVIIDKEGIKSGAELKELMDGGFAANGGESPAARTSREDTTVSNVVSGDVVEVSNTDIEFDEKPKPTAKKTEAKPTAKVEAKAAAKEEKVDEEFTIPEFSEDDFK